MLKVTRTASYRSLKRKVIGGLGLLFCVIFVAYSYFSNSSNINSESSRHLLNYQSGDYPADAFTKEQLKSGAVVLHVIGLFYLFLAIAIVCDDFFVPAIEILVDKLEMSPDTAGATFMAAGGSAPELFTAFIGTFIASSDVGFATIVGSAVFNVLFVIGCCAIFSTGGLTLTWYPFARDCLYYIVSLSILAGFFSDSTIYWYEALILLFLYVGYVTMMMNNAKVYNLLDFYILKTPKELARRRADTMLKPIQHMAFNVSLFKFLTADADLTHLAGVHMVSRLKGDVKATFNQVDENGDGTISRDELEKVLARLGGTVTEEDITRCYGELDANSDGKIDFTEFREWYIRSETRMTADVLQIFDKFDDDNSGSIDVAELGNLLKAILGPASGPITDDEIVEARQLLDANGDGNVSREEFLNWYKDSKFFKQANKAQKELIDEEKEEEDKGVDLTFPSSFKGRVFYIITAPIIYTLYYTTPDVAKERFKQGNWFILTFVMSIVWLAFYSYMMVWWATVFGEIAGIPSGVMGLTLLAAGTSVPDLLTSIIVARDGHGDMAVSSSIGSNIFDVLVGLPLPWFLYTISIGIEDGGKIEVGADSLFLSILILFGMLACVLTIIYCYKWKMTKALGGCMFLLYFIFVAQDLMRQYGVF